MEEQSTAFLLLEYIRQIEKPHSMYLALELNTRFDSIRFSSVFFLLLFDIARKLIHLQRLFLFSIHLALVIGTECHSVRFAIIRALFFFGWVLGGKINTRFIFHRLFLRSKSNFILRLFFLFNEKQTTND